MAYQGHSEHFETDSTVDLNVSILNTTDTDVEIRAHARDENAGQFLAGNAEAVTVGPRTDVDARQATDPNVGHFAVGFAPRGDPAATPPSMAYEPSADRRGTGHSTPHPRKVTYYGPHPSVSGAAYVGQSSVTGSELGCFADPSSLRPSVERTVTSNWGEVIPTTTDSQTNTTTILTSTYVTCSTISGPVQVQYVRCPPPTGLMSVHPARQVFVSQPVKLSGSFPRALLGLEGTPHPQFGNMERVWGEPSARSNLQPEFNVSQVASRPEDRAVDPAATGERYLNHGSGGSSAAVNGSDLYSQGGHGTRPKTTIEPQRMDPAEVEAG